MACIQHKYGGKAIPSRRFSVLTLHLPRCVSRKMLSTRPGSLASVAACAIQRYVRKVYVSEVSATVGDKPQCWRGSIPVPGRKQPLRHLVAVSRELALTAPGGDNASRRTILCADNPVFVLYRIAQRFGLPVVPEWAEWFVGELQRRKAIAPLIGLGCSPVVVRGTGKAFLHWIGKGVKCDVIRVPEKKGPINWPSFDGAFDPEATEPAILSENRSVQLPRPT